MQTITIATYLNDGPGRFFEYQPGDRLHVGPRVTLDAPDEASALDVAWNVGNRQPDSGVVDIQWAGDHDEWPSFVRSLSAGDVLVIGETAWAVAHVGFVIIDGADLARSIGPDAVESDRGSFGRPAMSRAEAGLR